MTARARVARPVGDERTPAWAPAPERLVPCAAQARGAAVCVGVVGALVATMLALPATVLADESPCASLYATSGPAGLDLRAACVAGRVADHYTAPGTSSPDVPSTLLVVLAVSWALAIVVFAAARWLSARAARRMAPVSPSAVWLCDACRSFNDGKDAACYRCRRPRQEGAASLEAGDPPPVDQHFGRPFGT